MIKDFWLGLKNWCNANQGLLTLFALIVAVFAVIPFNRIDFKYANPIVDKVVVVFTYNVKIPIYVFLAIASVSGFYALRIRRRYAVKDISIKFLSGTWMNEWEINGVKGSEILRIDEAGQYFLHGEHYFNIVNFQYDANARRIFFQKKAVKPGDKRNLRNNVDIHNNDLLVGLEQNYKIKYSRLPG